MAWYYGTYKELIMSVGESDEKAVEFCERNEYSNMGSTADEQRRI